MNNTPANAPILDFYRRTSKDRYQLTCSLILKAQTLWTLSDPAGCVIVDSGKEQCLPVWPSQETAQAWATAEHKACQPLSISLSDFIEKWVPGMTQDGFYVAIAPSMAAESIVESPEEFAGSLK